MAATLQGWTPIHPVSNLHSLRKECALVKEQRAPQQFLQQQVI